MLSQTGQDFVNKQKYNIKTNRFDENVSALQSLLVQQYFKGKFIIIDIS